ncbi:MAG: cytochrome c oxidase subunit I [Streptosporangiaceae bacterium]
MTATERTVTTPLPAEESGGGLADWLVTTDHKRIGLLTIGTGLILLFVMGALALLMRTQLAQANEHLISPQQYLQVMTMHGTGMIILVVTPLAIGLGVYLVPLQVGAPAIAAPRVTLLGYWLYVLGAVTLLWSSTVPTGGAVSGWWSYLPLSDSLYSPGPGQDLWIVGVFLATLGTWLMAGAALWTALRLRAPGVTMMRLPVFTWSMIVTCMMTLASFVSLFFALGILIAARIDPFFVNNTWTVTYQNLFWFYGHPVVYIMFFPFVGCVAEVLSTFAGRRFFGYKGTVLSLLAFSTISMAVWGHHMFATGQSLNDYFSLTSIMLTMPAGIEYFGMLGTIIGARLRFTTPMLFALTFIPQFLVGGLTGIMVAMPSVDYQFNDSYFIVGHFHYTLFAGSVFGLFAGLYFWFPKATGVMLNERIGKLHYVLITIGTNVTFLPFFYLGYLGMPRRVATYPAGSGFSTPSLIASVGSFIVGLSMLVFAYNVYHSVRHRQPMPPDPWQGNSIEWATSSPPPRFNFSAEYPVPRVRSFAPLLDRRLARERHGRD